MPSDDTIAALEAAGLVAREAEGLRTTRRWQAAMARAAIRCYDAGAEWRDLRLPVAAALLELFGSTDDSTLASYVDAMAALESAEFGGGQPAAQAGEAR